MGKVQGLNGKGAGVNLGIHMDYIVVLKSNS